MIVRCSFVLLVWLKVGAWNVNCDRMNFLQSILAKRLSKHFQIEFLSSITWFIQPEFIWNHEWVFSSKVWAEKFIHSLKSNRRIELFMITTCSLITTGVETCWMCEWTAQCDKICFDERPKLTTDDSLSLLISMLMGADANCSYTFNRNKARPI